MIHKNATGLLITFYTAKILKFREKNEWGGEGITTFIHLIIIKS